MTVPRPVRRGSARSVLERAHRELAQEALAHVREVPVEAHAVRQHGVDHVRADRSLQRLRAEAHVRAHAKDKAVPARDAGAPPNALARREARCDGRQRCPR